MLELLRRYSGITTIRITVNYYKLLWIPCELLGITLNLNYLDFLVYFLTWLLIFQLGYRLCLSFLFFLVFCTPFLQISGILIFKKCFSTFSTIILIRTPKVKIKSLYSLTCFWNYIVIEWRINVLIFNFFFLIS
jgi:hypothetical protein